MLRLIFIRRMIHCSSAPKSVTESSDDGSEYQLPDNCVTYFVPGKPMTLPLLVKLCRDGFGNKSKVT